MSQNAHPGTRGAELHTHEYAHSQTSRDGPWIEPSEMLRAGSNGKEGLNCGVVKHLSASDGALDRLNLIPCHYRITLTAATV